MPQKLNKAGQMQDYIPKGNGDASGEYGTSNGTNKNFTTSDKKESKANVITENKSVVVGDKKSTYKGDLEQQEKSLKDRIENLEGVIKNIENGDPTGAEDLQDMKRRLKNAKEDYERQFGKDSNRLRKILEERNRNEDIDHAIDTDYFGFGSLDKLEEAHKNNYGKGKANVIDGDLTGKKERAYDGSEYKSMTKEETQSIIDKLEKAGFEKDTSYSGGRTYKIYDKDTGNWNKISFSEDGKFFGTTINKGVYGYADLDTAIDRATYKSGKAPSDKAIGWETGAYDSKVYDAYSRKHTKYDD